MKRVIVRAPSNIALIKYMGKQETNLPENPSLSLTLSGLYTEVCLEEFQTEALRSGVQLLAWDEGEQGKNSLQLELNERSRVETHLKRTETRLPELVQKFSTFISANALSSWSADPGIFKVRTRNTFPSASGIASSASAFAAWTTAWVAARWPSKESFFTLWNEGIEFRQAIAQIAREGSGSSCRSFFGPWVVWGDESPSLVEPIRVHEAFTYVSHFVSVVSAQKKLISSSQAHHKVKTSPLWQGRTERARERFDQMKLALQSGDFFAVKKIAWQEFWEMHSLFHTAVPPFTFWTGESLECLRFLEAAFSELPVIITMDAGPNIHLVAPNELSVKVSEILKQTEFSKHFYLQDISGRGPEVEIHV